jgi:hypothetical protein
MALQPGQSTQVSMEFMMHAGMDGQHDFRLHLVSTDSSQPDKELKILSNWVN